jgi:hypothetical protein
MITAYRGLALLREAQGRLPEAVALMRKSLAVAMETAGPENASTATSHYRLGRMLAIEKHYAEAEQHLLRARDIRTKLTGPESPPTQDAIAALGKLYEAWGKPEKAKVR